MEESYGVERSCGVSDESTDVELGGVEETSPGGGGVLIEEGACGGVVDGEGNDGDGGGNNRDGVVLSDGGVDHIGLPGTISAGSLLNAVSSSRGGGSSSRGGKSGGCSRRKKRSDGLVEEPQPGVSKRMKDKMKQEELKRDMVDLQYIFNGIDEIMMNQVLKCADSNLAGLVKLEEECDGQDKPTFTQARKTSLKKFWDMSVMLSETKAQVAACPAVVNEVFEDLDLERILASEEDDGQFLALIREFEEAADLKIQEKWKEIGMKEVNKSDNYQKFLEVIYRYQDKNQDGNNNPGTSTGPPPGGRSTRNTERSTTTYHESQGVEELSEYIPTTDPVTRKLLKNPCKNKRCGHVYDYDSMMNLIITSGVKRMRCPYTSCPNKVPLMPDELVIDVVLARKIAEKIAAEQGT